MVTHLKRPLIISISVILGSFIIASIGLYILAGKVNATTDKIIKDKALIDKQTGALAVVASLKNQAAQAAVYQTAMEKLLPPQDSLIGFNQWIRDLASQDEVSASASFNGNISPPSSGAGQAAFSLSVDGSIGNIVAFLDDIESQAPGFLLQVNSFDLANTNGGYRWTGQGVAFFR